MPGHLRYRKAGRAALVSLLLCTVLMSGCLGGSDDTSLDDSISEDPITLTVWHTFAAESKEENVFLQSIQSFETANPNITVDVALVPFGEAANQFMTAAQGGVAPDLMRLSSDQLGAIGEVRVDGFPLLEDLRPHLTPVQRNQFQEQALHAIDATRAHINHQARHGSYEDALRPRRGELPRRLLLQRRL